MSSRVSGAAAAAIVGLLIGGLLLAAVYHLRPGVALEMDRDLPHFVSGFHGAEISGSETFAWTADRAVVRLAGLDRHAPWTCIVRVRGSRSTPDAQPEVTISIDGTAVAAARATNAMQDIMARAPVRPDRAGLTLAIVAEPTFVPGGGDRRVLGVQVDRIACRPDRGWVLPPADGWTRAAAASGVVAAAAALAGVSVAGAGLVALLVAVAGAVLLTTGGGMFGPYPDTLFAVAASAAAAILVVVEAPRMARRPPLRGAARAAVLAAALAFFCKLAALLHPAKALVDAVFNAHRLAAVMSGQYFFTQPMPNGVQFPYAIALYVVAMPWMRIATDAVTLLRVIVLSSEAIAGALLYVMVAKGWRDRRTGVLAVILFALVPLPDVVVGNANLPNAFGQSVAVMTLAAVSVWALGPGRIPALAGVSALAALAFLSHVSTVVLLFSTLIAVAAAFRLFGGRDLRPASRAVLIATAIAAVLSVGLYYGRFTDVYARALTRVSAVTGSQAPAPGAGEPAVLTRQLSLAERATLAERETTSDIGWPLLLLAVLGGWRACRARPRDRLSLVLAGWLAVWAAFVAFSTFTRVDTAFQRYTVEFLGRVNLASYPAAVILAARGATWAWDAGGEPGGRRLWRVTSAGLVVAAVVVGVDAWLAWLS